MSNNSSIVISTSCNPITTGSSSFINTFTHCNNLSNLNTPFITVANNTSKSYEIVTQNIMKDSLYRAFNEMNQEDCAKILYACLIKMLSDEKREELETLLKMCNSYQTVVKQIIKL